MTRQSEKTRLLVHHSVNLIDGVTTNAREIEDSSWVNSAATSAHDKAIKWSKAHGGLKIATILNSGKRSTRTKVAANQLVSLTVGKLIGCTPNVAVRSTVSAVLADVVFINNIARKSIAMCLLWHIEVERSIANDYIADLWEEFATNLNNISLSIVMKRSKWSNLTNLSQDLIVYNGRLWEVPTTLNNTVTNAINWLINSLKDVKDMLNSSLVIRKSNLKLLLLSTKLLVTNKRTFDTDTLAVSFCVNLAGVNVKKLILKR